MKHDEAEHDFTLDDIVESFANQLERGENPSIEEYKRRHPHLAERIDAVLPALMALEDIESQPDANEWIVDDSIPKSLGDYRIVQEIGRGGMGVVFEAIHTKMRRRVALKILPKSSAKKSNYLDRFLTEARSAGLLHHTNIVPVFEVAEENGLHYYTMQYIHGDSLERVIDDVRVLRNSNHKFSGNIKHRQNEQNHQHADAAASRQIANSMIQPAKDKADSHLGHAPELAGADQETVGRTEIDSSNQPAPSATVQRKSRSPSATELSEQNSTSSRLQNRFHYRVAAIGVQVANALQYAHNHGVLHRDIKPANLLLDSDGNVWVTDFGLAKFETDDLTRTGDIIGTLRYMAPERFDGIADPRSDIYSLGLTLYELCTLRCAFQNDRGTLVKDVAERSNVIHPRKIDETIPADLETIILKSIDARPEQRYQTAEAMAEDLQLFLTDRPIKARRITNSERLWRLCRRNPITASLIASILLLLLTVAIGSTLAAIRINHQASELKAQNIRATNHLALTEETIEKMLVRIGHELSDVPQMDAIRHGLYSDALELQKKMLSLEPDNPRVRVNTAAAHRRMAEALSRIGRHQQSLEMLQQTDELLNTLPADSPEKLSELVQVYTLLGAAHRERGNTTTSESYLQKAISAVEEIAPSDRNPASLIQLARAHRQLGALQQQDGRIDQAADSMQAALDALEIVESKKNHDRNERTSALVDVLNSLAIVYRSSGQYEQAEDTYRQALRLRPVSNDLERPRDTEHQMGITALNLGNMLMRQRRYDEATDVYEQAAKIYRRLRQDFPMNISYQRMVARTEMSLGMVYAAREEFDTAEAAYRTAISQSELLKSIHGSDLTTLDTHAVSLTNLGNLLKKQHHIDEAIEMFERSIELRQRHAERQPRKLSNLKSLALTQANLANTFIDQSEYELAHDLLLDADVLLRKLLSANSQDPSFVRVADFNYKLLVELMLTRGEYQESVPWIIRRFEISKMDSGAVTKMLISLKNAATEIKSDDSVDQAAKQAQSTLLAETAVEQITAATKAGWLDEEQVLQSEHCEWLSQFPEFRLLIETRAKKE